MNDLIYKLEEVYKVKPLRAVKSPLRICPLGAHVDHQGGLVTGVAVDSNVNLVYASNDKGFVRVQSLDFPDEEYFSMSNVPEMVPGSWGNYIRGAVLSLKRDYVLKKGITGIISGKLPIGGLSSSAAVTTAYLMALCDVNDIKLDKMELVKYSHWVETDFIGLKNGILDQSSNILSEKNKLMVMDCLTDEYHLVDLSKNVDALEFVIVYSGISTGLMGTDYNNRVDECKVASWLLKEYNNESLPRLKDSKLRQVDKSIYDRFGDLLPGRFQRRAAHYYTEQERVSEGIKAWSNGDLVTFGKLMNESGNSSVYLYESGCPELITIFNLLKNTPGVYGARFSGAGYRGCCIGLINPRDKETIKKTIDESYPKLHPLYKDVYKVSFAKLDDGARYIEIN